MDANVHVFACVCVCAHAQAHLGESAAGGRGVRTGVLEVQSFHRDQSGAPGTNDLMRAAGELPLLPLTWLKVFIWAKIDGLIWPFSVRRQTCEQTGHHRGGYCSKLRLLSTTIGVSLLVAA